MDKNLQRIPELDVLRGLCVIGMVAVHFLFDLTFFRKYDLALPHWFRLVSRCGHILFLLISGICGNFSRNLLRRGLAVWFAALLISYGTLFGELILGIPEIRIWFGILHLLGTSMILYFWISRLSTGIIAVLGLCALFLGLAFHQIQVNLSFLFPLGLCSPRVYAGSDYFPVFPGLGWFLLGGALGQVLYPSQETLLPQIHWQCSLFFLPDFFGRHALVIYLIHQPILYLICSLL